MLFLDLTENPVTSAVSRMLGSLPLAKIMRLKTERETVLVEAMLQVPTFSRSMYPIQPSALPFSRLRMSHAPCVLLACCVQQL